MSEYRYKAFISYSHEDEKAARWLHRSLETYRPPKRAWPGASSTAQRPRRPLAPVFRDQDELVAAASLSDSIQEALAESEYLIVICSPAAAASHWVEQEILAFKQYHSSDKVIAAIAEGAPDTCFPKALLYELTEQGEYSATKQDPLAADLQGGRSNRRMAFLKIAAAMLRLDLDTLVQRAAQRRAQVLSVVTSSALFAMLLMGWLTSTAINERQAADLARAAADEARLLAESRRQASEDLIEFMLGDLKDRLEPVGRLDALDAVGAKVLAYYGDQDKSSLDAESLGRRARSLHMLGEIEDLKGDSTAALALFRQAAASTQELWEAQPDDPQRIFEHSQSLYWVGVVAMQRGEYSVAAEALKAYLSLSQQLTRLQPEEEQWHLEVFYAHQVLGGLAMQVRDWPDAIRSFSRGLEVLTSLRQSPLGSGNYLNEVASLHSWLRSAYLGEKDYSAAYRQAGLEISTWERVLDADPRDYVALRQLLVALRGDAHLALISGDVPKASESLQRAAALAKQLTDHEPDDTRNLEQSALVAKDLSALHQLVGDEADARNFTGRCLEGARDLVRRDSSNIWWQVGLLATCELQAVRQTISREGNAQALEQLRSVYERLQRYHDGGHVERDLIWLWGEANLLRGDLVNILDTPEEAREFWLSSREALIGEPETLSSERLRSLVEVLERLGEVDRAGELAQYLWQRGYRYPGFTLK